MKRITILVLSCLGFAAGGCESNPVGRTCFISSDAGVGTSTVISSPALECQSRTCLHYMGTAPDMCTAECSSDDDCDKVAESACEGRFVCAIPVVVGPFCCRTMCICEDYLPPLDAGLPVPASCIPEDPLNECCNLDGRRDRPDMYPLCAP
jgi:hypothetical protein